MTNINLVTVILNSYFLSIYFVKTRGTQLSYLSRKIMMAVLPLNASVTLSTWIKSPLNRYVHQEKFK